jgi:pSer/pThr/pTyr-binding forkhead associated (FHA) protein
MRAMSERCLARLVAHANRTRLTHVIYFSAMADPKDSVLDKAESLARRILERLGSNVDKKIAHAELPVLGSSQIGDLASRLERLTDSSLREDERGTRRVAPNRFKVLFTYEETSKLSPQYIEAVGKELTATLFEYINNRRYATQGPVVVTAERDLFAKSTVVKATFDGDSNITTPHESTVSRDEGLRKATFTASDGRNYVLELRAGAAPAYIGRAAGNAIRIDEENVSRLHCSLSFRTGQGVVIADVGSANGTYVNEELLGRDEARLLKPGDIIAVGDCKLTLSGLD